MSISVSSFRKKTTHQMQTERKQNKIFKQKFKGKQCLYQFVMWLCKLNAEKKIVSLNLIFVNYLNKLYLEVNIFSVILS